MITIDVPQKAVTALTAGKRFTALYGGRGSAKSWSVAIYLLTIGLYTPTRILCCREVQNSISDSVHSLLSDRIKSNPTFERFYTIQKNEITGANGTTFIFRGLKKETSASIKSIEGIDYCWVEEAQSVSRQSLEILTPTIRKKNSKVIFTFNPTLPNDPVYVDYVLQYRTDTIRQKINYNDNPFFPDVLRSEMEYDKAYDYNKYLHVWEGEPIAHGDAQVYYSFSRENNLVETPFDAKKITGEVWYGWDFGVSDDTAIMAFEIVPVPRDQKYKRGYKINIVWECVANEKPVDWYKAQVRKNLLPRGKHACDPSGAARNASLKSWVSILSAPYDDGIRGLDMQYQTRWKVADHIIAGNEIIPAISICEEQCPKTVEMFEQWSYPLDKNNEVKQGSLPIHDKYSHLGTAFYYFAINRFPPVKKENKMLLI